MVFAIHWHESATGVHVSPSWTPLPPPSPSHPSGSSQCTSPERPVSCIRPGLAICFTYGNIHVSVLFSQFILPSPSPTESKSLFFISVSLLLPAGRWQVPCTTHSQNARAIWLLVLQRTNENNKNWFVMRWMKLEPIIQSEVSQKEKHQYSILTHIYGI